MHSNVPKLYAGTSSAGHFSGFKVYASKVEQNSLLSRAVKTCGRIVKWVLRLAAISLILVAVLPSILSTSQGLKVGTSLASYFVDGEVQIERAELGWLKPVHLHGVTYSFPEALGGDKLATAESLSTKSRLWDVVIGRKYEIYGEKPWVDCTFSQSGQWKWTQLSNYAAGKATLPAKSSTTASDTGASSQPSLVQETSTINFSAEARLMTASLFFPEGVIKVPREVKEVIGKDLHIIAVLGRSCLDEAAKEFDLDVSWAEPKIIQTESTAPLERSDSIASTASFKSASSDLSLSDDEQASGDKERSSLQGASYRAGRDAMETASPESGSWFKWETQDPGLLEIQSENLKVNANGWRRRADGAYLLNKPARVQFEYTPALAEYVLGRLSPLLSGVLAVDNGIVGVDVTPENLMSPAENYHFRIDPLRIAIQRQGMLKSAIDFLRLKKSGVDTTTLLQGATSAIHVDVGDDGSVETQRIDLLVSPGGKSRGVHLCSWGGIKPTQDRIDLNLGIPADTLSYMGLQNARKDDVLVVPLKGTFSRPAIDWRGAYSRLSALAASRTKEPTSIRSAILQGIARSFDQQLSGPNNEILEIPKPVEPLPWESDSRMLEQDFVDVEE